jgi:hypothetical protein
MQGLQQQGQMEGLQQQGQAHLLLPQWRTTQTLALGLQQVPAAAVVVQAPATAAMQALAAAVLQAP